MPTLTIRRATAADVPAVAALREASGWTGGAREEVVRRYLEGTHHPQGALAPRTLLLAERDGALVGYVAGHRTTRLGGEGELQWLLVAPDARGEGVADALLGMLARWFEGEGIARVLVNVAPENAAARRFYARLGAQPLDAHWMAWADVGAAVGARADVIHVTGDPAA